jgi:glyoxylase-like metal-dependent hydrolase (beta-lactamase superfamily II)
MKENIQMRYNYFFLIVLLANLYSCNPQTTSQADETGSIIDSLIQIKRINERTIVVVFGADAISAIKTEEGIVVIDAGISTGLTKIIRKKIEEEFKCSNFCYVINTHAHPDHYGGNRVFSASKIIGHVNGLKEMDERLADSEKVLGDLGRIVDEYDVELQSSQRHSDHWIRAFEQKTRYQYAYNDVKNLVPIKQPGITFSDSLNISAGDMSFELKYFGKCHSSSDILVYVPELKLLFSGDLVSQYGRPSINDRTMSEKEQWYNAIQWSGKRLHNIESVISGHGEILSADDFSSFLSNRFWRSSYYFEQE